jgi:Flp pilus assembly protein TadD
MSVGEAVPSHLQTLRNGKLLDLKTLLAVEYDSPYYRDKDKLGMFYAESWALAHMLHLSEKYRTGVANFVNMMLRGEPDALHAAFGRTDAEIEKDRREYISRESWPRVNLPVTTIAKLGKIPAEPLTELDSALLLGDLFAVSKKPAEAEKRYQTIVKAHPRSAEAEAALGYLALQRSEDDDAVAHLRRALELGLRSGRLCYDLATLLREQGSGDAEVLDLLRQSVQFDPDLYESRYFLGHFALRMGRSSEALENLKHAADLQPNRPQVWEDLALAYLENKDRDRAVNAAKRAIQLATNEPELARTQATLHLVEHKTPPAMAKPVPQVSKARSATRVEGTLTQIDCLGESARLRIEQPNGKMFLLVRDPHAVSLKNAGAVSFEFACGPMEPRGVIIEFVPARNETYGTTGEIRTIEFR